MKACNQCGKCCTKYSYGGLSATASEIEMWEIFRPDIFDYVDNDKIWVSPVTGELLEICPWLRKVSNQNKFSCDIYEDRPADCKSYPVSISQMVVDECEMLEPVDFSDVKRAQTKLDLIMSDSRPAQS
jgi:Fe-S-cluster containining protein